MWRSSIKVPIAIVREHFLFEIRFCLVNVPEDFLIQVAQELGRMWKNVSVDERDMYERKALADKERYAEEMRDYKTAITKIPGLEHLEEEHHMHLVHVDEHDLQQGQIV
ncbi:HMG box [Dictyocaulus viviparus]|uniref:HMG box n=1 Tax=Dictyocaulus viviparus TaxID=29172 RepID=A0A0D8XZF6_DICVI|nr:HMG box [Dictyocaulus viviparus]